MKADSTTRINKSKKSIGHLEDALEACLQAMKSENVPTSFDEGNVDIAGMSAEDLDNVKQISAALCKQIKKMQEQADLWGV